MKKIDIEYLDKLSIPKYNRIRYKDMEIIKRSDPMSPVSVHAKRYDATPNVCALAVPKKEFTPEEEDMTYENPYDIPREYRNVKTFGTKKLAEPKSTRKKFLKGDNASVVFVISPNALKCKPSEYTTKLAEARKDLSEGENNNAFSVKPAALKKLNKVKNDYYSKLATAKKVPEGN